MVSEWTGNLLNGQDSARGACVDEKAAGSACIAGSGGPLTAMHGSKLLQLHVKILESLRHSVPKAKMLLDCIC